MGAGASRARRKSKDYIIAATTPIDSLSPESSIFSVAEVQSTVEVLFACDESELSAAELQNRWKLGPSDFSLFSDQLISGRGTTSRVVCASIHGSNNLAAKRYDSPQPAIWRDYFDRELLALSHIQHSNVVTLVGVCDAPESRCIIMERAQSTLDDLLQTHAATQALVGSTRAAPLLQSTRLLRGVAHGMAAVHAHRFLHLDLKPANILISADGQPLIADFGLSIRWEKPSNTFIEGVAPGTMPYKAPELFRKLSACSSELAGASGVGAAASGGAASGGGSRFRVGPETDVYAFAMLMWQGQTLSPPWHGESQAAIMAAVLGGERPIAHSERGVGGDATSTALSALMASCWAQQPQERPRFDEVASTLDIIELTRSSEEAAMSDAARRAEMEAAERRVQRAVRKQVRLQAQLAGLERAAAVGRLQFESRAKACGHPPWAAAELQVLEACEEELVVLRTAQATLETDLRAGRQLAERVSGAL